MTPLVTHRPQTPQSWPHIEQALARHGVRVSGVQREGRRRAYPWYPIAACVPVWIAIRRNAACSWLDVDWCDVAPTPVADRELRDWLETHVWPYVLRARAGRRGGYGLPTGAAECVTANVLTTEITELIDLVLPVVRSRLIRTAGDAGRGAGREDAR